MEVLVNCAGAAARRPFAELDSAAWHGAMEAKFHTYMNAIDVVVKRMAARQGGSIVNVIGMGGKFPSTIHLAGGSANAALMLATAGLAVVVDPIVACGDCEACRGGARNVCPDRRIVGVDPEWPGAYAESLVVPAENAVPFVGDVPLKARKLVDVTYEAMMRGIGEVRPGATLGDKVSVSHSVSLGGTRIWGEVTAADTVTVYQRNDTAAPVDVASGVLSATVTKTA